MSKQKYFVNIGIIFLILLLAGCQAEPIYDIPDAGFTAIPNLTLAQVHNAVLRGAKKAGWESKSLGPDRILASYFAKRNKYGAVVMINFDLDSYQITYQSSHNLKYKKFSPQSNGDDTNYFIENNPFKRKMVNQNFQRIPDATIHKVYNQWVGELKQKLDFEFNLMTYSKPDVTVTAANKESCNDVPVKELSGRATIRKNRVNLRSGASTRCNILGVVKQAESFILLGRKKNWYYIALEQGHNAWIYAPLVVPLAEQQSVAKPIVTVQAIKEAPPSIPTKKITIAVIRFKTLNKQAQDIALGELVSEIFTSALVNAQSFKIIEREQLDKVVKEIEMNETGFIESTDAVEIGKMLSADAIITGSVALLGNQIQLNARIIEIESAFVISADSKTAQYTLKNINQITNDIVYRLSKKLIQSSSN